MFRIWLAILLILATSAPVGADRGKGDGFDLTRPQREALFQAQQALTAEKADQALAIIRAHQKKHPRSSHYLIDYLTGLAHQRRNDRRAAVLAYTAALKLKPDYYPARMNLALAHYEQGQFGRAAEQWEQAAKLKPDQAGLLLYQAATAYYQAKAHDRVIRAIRRVNKGKYKLTAGQRRDCLQLLVQAHLERKEYGPAEAAASDYVNRYPGAADYWRLLSQVRLQRKKYQAAAAALETALALDKPKKHEYKQLAEIYFFINCPLKGAAALAKAWDPNPTPDQLDRLAGQWIQAGRPNRALACLDQALAVRATAERYLAKGRLLLQSGDHGPAAQAFGQALALAPKSAEAVYLRGYCLVESGRLNAAAAVLRHCPPDSDYAEQVGQLVDSLERLIEQRPDNSADQ